MLKLSVSKSHPVTRYEVAPTERQTEDVLVEPTLQSRRPNRAPCFVRILIEFAWILSWFLDGGRFFSGDPRRQFAVVSRWKQIASHFEGTKGLID